MTMTRPTWTLGPPPPADGLQSAFRAADRRRVRAAAMVTGPALLIGAAVFVASVPGGGTDSLQLPPSQRSTSAPTAPNAVAGQQPAARTAPAPAAAGGSEPDAGAARANEQAPVVPGVPHETSAPAQGPGATALSVTAARSASTTMRLGSALHPDMTHVSFTRSGTYAGLWILDAHGTTVASAFVITDFTGDRYYSRTPDVLAPGTYTVYLLAKERVTATVPLGKKESGRRLTATRPATAAYTSTSHTMSAVETSYQQRLHIPVSGAVVGYAGGFVDTRPGGASSSVAVCLPRRDAACASSDPHAAESSALNVGGGYGSSFALTRPLMSERRDVLLDAEVKGTGSTVATCWAFTVQVS
jgi:hypothetical protein